MVRLARRVRISLPPKRCIEKSVATFGYSMHIVITHEFTKSRLLVGGARLRAWMRARIRSREHHVPTRQSTETSLLEDDRHSQVRGARPSGERERQHPRIHPSLC